MTIALPLLLLAVACESSSAPRNGAPMVQITEPAGVLTVPERTAVIFKGGATDPEDGPLPGAALTWSSSLDGALGSGSPLTVSTLSVGQHTISLRATDDSGAHTDASVTITVTMAAQALGLDTVAVGLNTPVFLTAAPGDDSRLFIVEKRGAIRIIQNGALLATPFLDISSLVINSGEQGFLGLAFDPGYQSTGRFYVSYVGPRPAPDTGTRSVVARYTVSANPDVANSGSAQVIITENQPYSNHNGGMIAFGADGYLYYGLGDGGSGGDPLGNGQDLTDLLGSILRLDVSGNGGYTIPASNPYFNDPNPSVRQELWNYGLRNPWRWSFDRQTHDLYVADVGQNAFEEVDVQPSASTGGENYGWNIMEGLHCYPSGTCNQVGLTLPVLEYGHSEGCSVTGGYVYRGAAIPSLQGHYLYADYCSGWVRSFRWIGGVATDLQDRPELSPGSGITSFGEDDAGELYVLRESGIIYRIVAR
jgi:glucose/arabinose dehydrogenase